MRCLFCRVALLAAAMPLLGGVPAHGQTPSAATQKAEPSIKGIVFVPRADDIVAKGVTAPASQIDTSRVPLLDAPDAQTAIRRYIGLPIRPVLLDSLRAAIGQYYGSINRPFVSVAIPKQDVTDGVIQVVVVEGHLGKLAVSGNRWFDEAQYRDAIRLAPGGPIDNAVLKADIDWINRNSYRHAAVAASAGAKPGDTDLMLQAQDRFPVSVSAGIDNTGTASTGLYRPWTSIDWGNAFRRGDDLNYRFTTAENPRLLKQHGFAYTTSLPWRDTLNLSGSIVDDTPRSSSPVSTTGHNDYASLRYQHALPTIGTLAQTLTLGYDFKSTNNNILFGGVSVFPTTTEIDEFPVIYGATLPDRLGSTNLTATLVGSPGNITALNNTATFQTQQAGARANYLYGNISVERLTDLPEGITWDAKGFYQWSSGILLASEQLGFGGPYANRGFATTGATRDEGFQTMHELRAPAISPNLPGLLGIAGWPADQFQPFVFFDFGIGWNHPAPGTNDRLWVSETTIGPGFTYQIDRFLAVRFTYGVPVQHSGATGDTLRSQFSVTLTY